MFNWFKTTKPVLEKKAASGPDLTGLGIRPVIEDREQLTAALNALNFCQQLSAQLTVVAKQAERETNAELEKIGTLNIAGDLIHCDDYAERLRTAMYDYAQRPGVVPKYEPGEKGGKLAVPEARAELSITMNPERIECDDQSVVNALIPRPDRQRFEELVKTHSDDLIEVVYKLNKHKVKAAAKAGKLPENVARLITKSRGEKFDIKSTIGDEE